MEKIKSFTIDHDHHDKGFYLSGESKGIYTYDLRFKTPNGGDYLQNASMHSIEHMFATVIRNSQSKDNVVYFGPMGCRTGFYLLLNGIGYEEARRLTAECLRKCLELDSVPGCMRTECGNYAEHDLESAKKDIAGYLKVIDK